jgi:hypothetical protein
LCGDSGLALAILLEVARRAWELAELAKAAAIGGEPMPSDAPLPVERVVLVDPRSDGMLREYEASMPRAVLRSGPTVVKKGSRWQDFLLEALDAPGSAAPRRTAVIIVDGGRAVSMHEGGRIARLHPDIPVFVLASPGKGVSRPIFGRLVYFERGLLVHGDVPEDIWRRIARHWHEYYRLSHPVAPGDPRAAKRLPWAQLDQPTRVDNILQLRSILTQVASLGRRWEPARLVPPGSFIELSERELEQIALAEHTRWYRQRTAEGWSPAANSLVVPWAELLPEEREARKDHVRSQVKELEDVGFMPVVPPGGPPGAKSFERTGIVLARRMTAPLRWSLSSREQMLGNAGDWRVVDSTGALRTVTDPEFRSSHEPLGHGRWRRTGIFTAWQVSEEVVVRTREGNATARPGEWVIEGSAGERWPIGDDQFQASYRARPERPVRAGPASTAAAISSSTAPTISS